MHQSTPEKTILRDLGDGLVLRRGTLADAEALSSFNARLHGSPDGSKADERIGTWTRDLVERPHPTFSAADFTIVEDTGTGAIVSTCNLISQRWSYAGIPFGVGRPELVGTLADYRRKGLVRAQFDVLHQWSAERGEMVQAITGIPFYYRQFGYDMAVDLGGGRVGYRPHMPKLKKEEAEPYHVRQATRDDLGFIAGLYARAQQRYLLSAERDEALWQYELDGRSPGNVSQRQLCVVETSEGEAVGYFAHPTSLWGPTQAATQYEVKPGIPWTSVTPTVLRYLWKLGEQYAADLEQSDGLGAVALGLGAHHPVYATVQENVLPRVWEAYAWYIRVPDLPGFLRHVAPVLDERMAASPMAGYTGDFKISFYRDGVRLVFENGSLRDVEAWRPTHEDGGKAAFPNLTFLQLLFGYRTFEEVHYAYVDAWAETDEARALLASLFPKQPSDIWPIA
jgi:hypothetical protein